MMQYTLTKLSYPDWEFITEHEDHVLPILDKLCICEDCKQKKPEDDKDHSWDFCLPSNYDILSVRDKVYALLGTACGCEYSLDEIDIDVKAL